MNLRKFLRIQSNGKAIVRLPSSTLVQIKAAKNYMEAIINSVKEPIIGLNNELTILFIMMRP